MRLISIYHKEFYQFFCATDDGRRMDFQASVESSENYSLQLAGWNFVPDPCDSVWLWSRPSLTFKFQIEMSSEIYYKNQRISIGIWSKKLIIFLSPPQEFLSILQLMRRNHEEIDWVMAGTSPRCAWSCIKQASALDLLLNHKGFRSFLMPASKCAWFLFKS